jgi:hypothetical protein
MLSASLSASDPPSQCSATLQHIRTWVTAIILNSSFSNVGFLTEIGFMICRHVTHTASVFIVCTVTAVSAAQQPTTFTRFDYTLIPSWCDTVLTTRNDQTVAELKLGQVFRAENPGTTNYGYRCKAPGHSGVSFNCPDSSLLLIVYGLNIEGGKERKITVLCLK